MRFFWKAASDVCCTDAGKAKILRNVQFPKCLDIFEFCTDELKQSLMQGRDLETKNRAAEDASILEGKKEEEKKQEGGAAADIEMQEEESKEQRETKKLVGAAAKHARK